MVLKGVRLCPMHEWGNNFTADAASRKWELKGPREKYLALKNSAWCLGMSKVGAE